MFIFLKKLIFSVKDSVLCEITTTYYYVKLNVSVIKDNYK